MVSRRIYAGLLGVLAVPLTVVSLAWACVPRGALTVSPASAPSGSTVSVAASGFPRDVPVDVRWNGLSGPRLSSGVGPGFTVDITVPRVAPGAYVISAATTDEHASHSGGRAAFEVTGGADSPAPTPGQATNPPPVNPFAPDAGRRREGHHRHDPRRTDPRHIRARRDQVWRRQRRRAGGRGR